MSVRARRRVRVGAIALSVVLAFFAGKYWEHFKRGRWYQVHDEQTYEFPQGKVHLRHVTETVGVPFLDPGDSVITLEADVGEVKLYQSSRVFQESVPWVSGVQTQGNELRWSDGIFRYTLRLEKVGPTTQP